MIVYRITTKDLSAGLKASGHNARWNSKGKYVIYTSSSRALACLENIVHRSGEGLNNIFKVLIIEVPDKIKISEIKIKKLKADWHNFQNYNLTQKIGDEWISNCETCVLKVPSVIIKEEYNFIINPAHTEFKLIKILKAEDFGFDKRLK